jgi:hypothetical protein
MDKEAASNLKLKTILWKYLVPSSLWGTHIPVLLIITGYIKYFRKMSCRQSAWIISATPNCNSTTWNSTDEKFAIICTSLPNIAFVHAVA